MPVSDCICYINKCPGITDYETNKGMSSIGFKKKERLRQLAEEALQWPDSFVADATGKLRPHPAIKAALQYIKNAADNIQVIYRVCFVCRSSKFMC